jgi:hypothetical protein
VPLKLLGARSANLRLSQLLRASGFLRALSRPVRRSAVFFSLRSTKE